MGCIIECELIVSSRQLGRSFPNREKPHVIIALHRLETVVAEGTCKGDHEMVELPELSIDIRCS
eukprot:scaffold425_cov175-Amphora_coffeaeformis.AAC.96